MTACAAPWERAGLAVAGEASTERRVGDGDGDGGGGGGGGEGGGDPEGGRRLSGCWSRRRGGGRGVWCGWRGEGGTQISKSSGRLRRWL